MVAGININKGIEIGNALFKQLDGDDWRKI